MATGWLAWTCLLLAAGSPPADDVVYINQRGFQIPIKIQPERQGDVRELILYVSRNQGASWEIHARAQPDRKAFDFFTNRDESLYFSVAVKDRFDRQDPPDIYKAPVGQKIVIDTVKPVVRILSAERVVDEIHVSWEVQEEHPEWTSLKLEWRPIDSPGSLWTPLAIQPGPRGNLKFKPVVAGEIVVRLALRDLAGNASMDEKMVPVVMRVGGAATVSSGTTAPGGLHEPSPPPPPTPPPSTSTPMAVSSPSSGSPGVSAGATSQPIVEPTPPLASTSSGTSTGPAPTRGALPPLQIINKRQAKLSFNVAKFGPSGLGSVDVYLTTDEGASWDKAPGEPAVTLPVSPETKGQTPLQGIVTVQLPADGKIYGFYLVVKSRAGLGKEPPRPGEPPQVRIEVDTTQPSAELYQPQPDPGRPDSLLLNWKAEDRNLAANPISLEWATSPQGPWEFIGDPQLPNTGRYTWRVAERTPPKVYLRLTVRDTAGNAAVAQTPEPVLIDLSRPEINNVQLIRQ